MKKFLAIFLTVCMMLSVSALAAETTYVDPFILFDFGSESRLDDMWKANVLSAWKGNNAVIEENDDSWTLTVTNVPEFAGGGSGADVQKIPAAVVTGIGNITYGAIPMNNGWGGYKPSGYKTSTDEWNYALDSEWVGKNQFMKIRLKNGTSNTIMGFFLQNTASNMPYTAAAMFDVSANDTEFQTYIVDMCKAQARGATKGNYNSYAQQGQSTYISGNLDKILFYPFGAWAFSQYGNASDNTYTNIQLGDTVEVDYMIFAATAEMAAEYKSIAEGYVPAETTTTEKVETTTTESVVETTTTESVVETTTTESVVETTTTESVVETTTTVDHDCTTTESVVETTTTESVVETTTTDAAVDETTTEAAVDQTTAPQDNSTTTTEQNTDDGKDGGFPVWIIIVIVVVIGGGVACFFVFKKK